MKVICPVTGSSCPYDQKLDAGVCPREHECDIARAAYSKMLKKPPSARKPIYISLAVVLLLAVAAILYFFVFNGNLTFLQKSPSPTGIVEQTPSPSAQPTVQPSAVSTPEPTELPGIPATGEDAEYVSRISFLDDIHEVKVVGLDPAKRIKAYPDALIVSWYEGSYLPGEKGNSIFFGFRHFGGVSGAFYSLQELDTGDTVTFTLDNGTLIEQSVYEIFIYDEDQLPDDVFALENNTSRTVLISQAGVVDSLTGDYTDMIVVYLR